MLKSKTFILGVSFIINVWSFNRIKTLYETINKNKEDITELRKSLDNAGNPDEPMLESITQLKTSLKQNKEDITELQKSLDNAGNPDEPMLESITQLNTSLKQNKEETIELQKSLDNAGNPDDPMLESITQLNTSLMKNKDSTNELQESLQTLRARTSFITSYDVLKELYDNRVRHIKYKLFFDDVASFTESYISYYGSDAYAELQKKHPDKFSIQSTDTLGYLQRVIAYKTKFDQSKIELTKHFEMYDEMFRSFRVPNFLLIDSQNTSKNNIIEIFSDGIYISFQDSKITVVFVKIKSVDYADNVVVTKNTSDKGMLKEVLTHITGLGNKEPNVFIIEWVSRSNQKYYYELKDITTSIHETSKLLEFTGSYTDAMKDRINGNIAENKFWPSDTGKERDNNVEPPHFNGSIKIYQGVYPLKDEFSTF